MRLNITEGGADKKRVPCPYCGKGSVTVDVITVYNFIKTHNVLEDGIEFKIPDDESEMLLSEIIGQTYGENYMYLHIFKCGSCGKSWYSNKYRLIYDKHGQNGHFEDGAIFLERIAEQTRREKREKKIKRERNKG